MKLFKIGFLGFVSLMTLTTAQASTCDTPSECFEVALGELVEAKEEIYSLKADLARTKAKLNSVVSDDRKWIGDPSGLKGDPGKPGTPGAPGSNGANGKNAQCSWNGWKDACGADTNGTTKGVVKFGLYCSNGMISNIRVSKVQVSGALNLGC